MFYGLIMIIQFTIMANAVKYNFKIVRKIIEEYWLE